MKLPSITLGLAAFAVGVTAQNGDGPYAPAGYQTVSSLGSHTIYRPNNAAAAGAMPVFVWGNGACSADGTSAQNFLKQVASYGFLVIASGSPGGGGSSTVQMMDDSIKWAVAGAGGLFNVNPSKIMVAGFSCGGTEAYNFQSDSRVTTIGIFSSGYLSNYDAARQIKKPIMFALGGSGDIAYANGERDYSYLPSGTPAWKGNVNKYGHGGFIPETNGGLFGKATVKWLQWVLKGDASAAAYFQGNAAVSDGWNDATGKSLNLISSGGGTATGGVSTTSGGTTGATPGPTSSAPTTTSAPPAGGCSAMYGQCGGTGWTGGTCCSQGSCKYNNAYYSQCL